MKSLKKYIAEFIGTFVLVLVACGVAVVTGCGTPEGGLPAVLMTALAFGGVIVAMAYSIGNISGCHINPAVSIAVLINGGMSLKDFIGYVIAQFAGAIAGAAVLKAILPAGAGLGQNDLIGIAAGQPDLIGSLIVEAILTCIFVLAVLGATSKIKNSSVAGLVIGGSLTLVHLLGIFFTGTSVNPARSFGPALFVGGTPLANYWVFLVGPMVGAVIAALLWKFLYGKGEEE